MRSSTTFTKLALVLSLLGILISGKLLSIHNRTTTGQAGLTETCFVGSSTGCAAVAVSDYSSVLGIPVAALAMGFYFAIFFLGLWAMRNRQAANEALYTSFFLSTVSVVVTVIMFSISNFVLKTFCPYCAMLWLVNLAIWPCYVQQLGLGWGNALAANAALLGRGPVKLLGSRVTASLGFAAASVAVMAIIGASAKGLAGQEAPQSESSLVSEYSHAPIAMLPAEAYGGPSSKGWAPGGATQAPVLEIAELADFQCPGCRMAAQLLRPFLLKHKDKVRITYHHFPLDGSCNPFVPNGRHGQACAAARGAICAGKQGRFWEYHDLVFDRQEELSGSVLDEIATQAGLDTSAHQACVKDPSTETELQKSMQLGDLIGLQSTPTLVLNGRKVTGARAPAELEALLRALEKGEVK